MKITTCLFAILLFALGAGAGNTAGTKPNVLFILADDMGYSDMSWQGSPIQTPNLDQLREGGMFLDRYYVQPQCTPSRVAFLTGNYPYRFGLHEHIVLNRSLNGIPGDVKTIAEKMQEGGYFTSVIGKWHVGFGDQYAPTEHGFDEAEWSEGNPAVWMYGLKGETMVGHVNSRAFNWAPKGPQTYYDEGGVLRAKKGAKPELVSFESTRTWG